VALILVTGSSAGLGLATATTLADLGHDIVLHARNPQRVPDQPALGRMREIVYGDLSDLDETVQLAQQANAIGRFDAVIHNAGVLRGPDVLAVNTVAPFVLTALMDPPERSIYLSSSMHMSGSTDLDPAAFSAAGSSTRAYENSKLYGTALVMALARLRPDVIAHAVDPGWVPTRMGGPSATDSLDEGYRTQVWLTTDRHGDHRSGHGRLLVPPRTPTAAPGHSGASVPGATSRRPGSPHWRHHARLTWWQPSRDPATSPGSTSNRPSLPCRPAPTSNPRSRRWTAPSRCCPCAILTHLAIPSRLGSLWRAGVVGRLDYSRSPECPCSWEAGRSLLACRNGPTPEGTCSGGSGP
jgi:NAD(P)-dependent dehydrogenase (short-subunit alcohol dehydrogenase family)